MDRQVRYMVAAKQHILLRGAHRYADKVLDDVVIFSNEFQKHLTDVEEVLNRLHGAGLTLNVKKYRFGTDRLKVFGFLLEEGKILPDPAKTDSIAKWPRPVTKKL